MSTHKRKIIEIDEEKCTGCGECIIACAEGALALVDGKARLVGDVYCDGLGACLGECPEGALRIVEREAEEFDEKAVEARRDPPGPAHSHAEEPLACGCPGSSATALKPAASNCESRAEIASELTHWPIKLQLLGPRAPFLRGSDLLLMADCSAAAYPNLHQKLLKGHTVALGCPKLDDIEAHIERLADILAVARPKSLTVVHMEVPCCHGFVYAAEKAIARAGVDVPLHRVIIGRAGHIHEKEQLSPGIPEGKISGAYA